MNVGQRVLYIKILLHDCTVVPGVESVGTYECLLLQYPDSHGSLLMIHGYYHLNSTMLFIIILLCWCIFWLILLIIYVYYV